MSACMPRSRREGPPPASEVLPMSSSERADAMEPSYNQLPGALGAPTLADVFEARRHIHPHLERSPLRHYASLDRLVGAEVWVKHDNLLPTGAFKVRGGVNLLSKLDDATRARGVIAASTGNHGQSVAFAARLFGVHATICAPAQANPVKVEAMRGLGADVVLVGRDFDEAREQREALAAEHGYRYIRSADEAAHIAGLGTHTPAL